jgi:hypothetical protein
MQKNLRNKIKSNLKKQLMIKRKLMIIPKNKIWFKSKKNQAKLIKLHNNLLYPNLN